MYQLILSETFILSLLRFTPPLAAPSHSCPSARRPLCITFPNGPSESPLGFQSLLSTGFPTRRPPCTCLFRLYFETSRRWYGHTGSIINQAVYYVLALLFFYLRRCHCFSI
ncbi:hypothetical protein B0H17DRAFT_351921 [Mycena rosella]|uniref:Secreted protein n=1 Tax=Mycena rosella TaxID=1033263 RepID=A0AAD7CQA9_MYCRO|nr:hypothetical protein B0H17DRAFT_351921 [Mycena rosella]